MKLNKPKFWNDNKNLISKILTPLSQIFIFVSWIRKIFYKKTKFNIPVICVGNIYIGGTGKTPLSILLAKELEKKGKKPVIIRKFYKNHIDEYRLIRSKLINLIVQKNRALAINQAIKDGFDTVVLDDGFQDYTINKNLNVICFNQRQLIGNGKIFPAGPLREKLFSLKDAEIVIINGKKDKEFEKKILNINENLQIFYSKYVPLNIQSFKDRKILAIGGIGTPSNFFQILRDYGINVIEEKSFPDHYNFKQDELKSLIDHAKVQDEKIIMTEKDYFRIKDYNLKEIDYLKVNLEIEKKEKLVQCIEKVYD